jgi:hypothetical protein
VGSAGVGVDGLNADLGPGRHGDGGLTMPAMRKVSSGADTAGRRSPGMRDYVTTPGGYIFGLWQEAVEGRSW